MLTQFARISYFGLQFLRREPVHYAWLDVLRTEYFNTLELKQLQSSRMISQLKYVVRNVPYYQDIYAPFFNRIQQLSSWDEVNEIMTEMPIIFKHDVQKNYMLFRSKDLDRINTYPDKTSGSTGTPLVFPCDQKAWAYRHALIFRMMKMHNVQIGEPYVLFFGLHWNRTAQLKVSLRDWVFNRLRVSAFDISRTTFEVYLKKIRTHKPTFFLGYPSAIYDFCFLAREFGVNLNELKLKAIFTTAEPLLTYQRELINQVTGSRCVNYYGSAECGFNAFECPDGNLHLSSETSWLRTGDIYGNGLLTDMMLRAFPMINYAIEDEIVVKKEQCSCGLAHPILESINGRSGDPILLPNGKIINANLPSYIFKPLTELRIIQKYRFVLQGDNLKLFLIVSERYNQEHLKLIERETKAAFGDNIKFTTNIVLNMELLPNAKHKCFVVLPGE